MIQSRITTQDLCSKCKTLLAFLEDPSITKSEVTYDDPKVLDHGCRICVLLSNRYLDLCPFDAEFEASLIHNWRQILIHSHKSIRKQPEDGRSVDHQLELHECRASDTQAVIYTDPTTEIYHRDELPLTTAGLPNYTGDDGCFDTIQSWMKTCTEGHEKCRKAMKRFSRRKISPTRLVEIVDKENLRIIDTSSKQQPLLIQYTTLSYRWNVQEDPKLLLSNKDRWKHQLSISTLPSVFRDAVDATERLGIHYIWIDALCIVQDDMNDWRHESSLMGQIYQNAILNLAASAAASTRLNSTGLYMERDPRQFSGILLASLSHSDTTWVLYHHSQTEEIWNEPLLRRGWVFQERLLSPRTVYFGSQLKWECTEILGCECFPSGSPHKIAHSQPVVPTWSIFPLRISTSIPTLSDKDEITLTPESRSDRNILYANWLHTVQEYTSCDLTVTTDRLPAIAGIAKEFQDTLKDEYVAGLWKGDMHHGVLWYLQVPLEEELRIEYTAPSWSWASISSPYTRAVSFPGIRFRFTSGHHRYIAEIKEVSTTAVGDPMGQLTSAFLRITGYMTKTHPRVVPTKHTVKWGKRYWGDNYDRYNPGDTRNCGSTFHFAIVYSNGDTSVPGEHDPPRTKDLSGLIIEQTGDNENEYRRIGMFHHPWGEFMGDEQSWNPNDFPEFLDFEPKNLQMTTITLV